MCAQYRGRARVHEGEFADSRQEGSLKIEGYELQGEAILVCAIERGRFVYALQL